MNTSVDGYIEIAQLAKRTHKQLLQLIDTSKGSLPKKFIYPLIKMEDYLFLFKDKAEKLMLKDCPEVLELHTKKYPDYTHIFYGGFKDIDNRTKENSNTH
ncbi:MAG: hypothetical protein ACXAC8_03140 [Candidatus Hodarchaeales archaeon]|jgi:hypothetical protein